MQYTIQMGVSDPYMDETKQEAIKAILEEHLGTPVHMEIIPTSHGFTPEFDGLVQDDILKPYWLKCSFEADMPPTENIFITDMMPSLVKILGNYFSYQLSFADPHTEAENIAEGCFKMSKMSGGAFEEEERIAIAQILREIKPNVVVKFHQSSDLLCEGMNIREYGLACDNKPSPDEFSIHERMEEVIRHINPQEELSCEAVAKSEIRKGKRK